MRGCPGLYVLSLGKISGKHELASLYPAISQLQSFLIEYKFQEVFRLLIYLLLRKADAFLRKLTENEETKIFRNKHILSYVVGLGFGAMSGAFSMVNVLADREV